MIGLGITAAKQQSQQAKAAAIEDEFKKKEKKESVIATLPVYFYQPSQDVKVLILLGLYLYILERCSFCTNVNIESLGQFPISKWSPQDFLCCY
jgi:hypothetical protein